MKNGGAIPPLHHKSSWHSTSLIKLRDYFTFFFRSKSCPSLLETGRLRVSARTSENFLCSVSSLRIKIIILLDVLGFFLIVILGRGVHTGSIRHVGHFWPIVPAQGDRDDGEIGGMKIGRGNQSTRSKPAPAPICPVLQLLK
jgi:hypothetical protein